MKKVIIKICVLMLIIGLNWAGFSAIGETMAYFSDTENSLANSMQAAMLDFSITNRHIESFIGMESLSEIKFASVVTKKIGSLNIQYEVNAEAIDGNNEDFCNALIMEAEHNGIEKHDGPLLSFSAPSTTQLGTWEFEIDLPASATNVPHGAECNVDLVFKGWRTDIVTFEESGFTDEERIELRLTSRMIVLNEFLPRPDGWAYGFDFGNDSSDMPQGEWVELYNNSDSAADLAGWYIWDDSGAEVNKIAITAANTDLAATVIPAGGWLVVYMNKAVLNNGGDTVKLYDDGDTLIDSHTYTDNDYCEIEPTPGDENATDTDGSCGGVPPNKSYARIPDGIGGWVDPIPTPGGPNTLVFEQNNFENQNNSENTVDDISTEETLIEETPAITQEDTNTADDELFTVEEPQEPISNPLDVGVIETTTPPDDGIAFEEETIVEEEPVAEEPTEEEVTPVPSIEDGATGQVTEENQEQEGIIEGINETIDEVIEEIVDEIMPDETVNDESVEETIIEEIEALVIEEAPIIEEAPADETLVVEPAESPSDIQAGEEQPAIVPDNSSSMPDGSTESGSNGGSGDGGSDTSGSLDDSSPTEGAGENSADGGEDSGSNGDTETGLGNSDE